MSHWVMIAPSWSRFLDRQHVDQRVAGQDHPGGVHAPLTLEALEALRGVDDLAGVGVGLVELPELDRLRVAGVARVEDAGQRDVFAHHRGRHGLGDAVADRERVAEHPGRVLDRGLRLDRAVGDDLRDPRLAVFLGGVADHLAAPAFVEVHVDVGHRDAVGVQEALEQQAVQHRVELGDAQRVGDQRARRAAAARADPDADALRVGDQVGGDQEVAREAHRQDDAQLVLGLLAPVFGHAAGEPPVQPALHLLAQEGLFGLPRRHRELRHQVAGGEQLRVVADLLGDLQRRVAGARHLGVPQRAHLGRRLEVVTAGVELEALGVGHRRTGLHAQQHLVCVGVLFVRVVQVVGRDGLEAQLLAEAQQVLPDPALDREPVLHQLEVVVVGAEDVAELGGRLARLVEVADAQPRLHLARRAPGGRDETLGVFVEQLAVGPGLVEVALQAGAAGQPEKVLQAPLVAGQHRRVGVGAAAGDVVFAAVGPPHAHPVAPVGVGRDVGLEPDDRLDPGGRGLLVEVVGAEQVAVVGHRQGGHLEPAGLLEQLLEPGGAVEHRVLGVHMQMHERVRHPRPPFPATDGADPTPRVRQKPKPTRVTSHPIPRTPSWHPRRPRDYAQTELIMLCTGIRCAGTRGPSGAREAPSTGRAGEGSVSGRRAPASRTRP
jgi:hypothetical protein